MRPTYAPAVVGIAIVLIAWGAVSSVVLSLLGALLLIVGFTSWFREIRNDHSEDA